MSTEVPMTGTTTLSADPMYINTTTTAIPVPIPRTTPSNSLINTEAQEAINYVLWGASAFALFVLFVRALIAVCKRFRHRRMNNLPFFGNESTCRINNDPPPNYSDLSVRTLPPTYSQACRMIHYHPSTGNTSQQSASHDSGVSVNTGDSTGSFENDFIARPSSSNDLYDVNNQTNCCAENATGTPRNNGTSNSERRVRFESDCMELMLPETSNQNGETNDLSDNQQENHPNDSNTIYSENRTIENVSATDQVRDQLDGT